MTVVLCRQFHIEIIVLKIVLCKTVIVFHVMVSFQAMILKTARAVVRIILFTPPRMHSCRNPVD